MGEVAERLRAAGVKLELGGHPSSIFFEQDLIVKSPGVPANLAPMVLANVAGIPVWSRDWSWPGDTCAERSWPLQARTEKRPRLRSSHTFWKLPAFRCSSVRLNIGRPLISLVESSTDSTGDGC